MSRTLIIGEPGCTAEGDFDTLNRLIDAAAGCGVDVFKNQWTSNAEQMCARRHAPEYLTFYHWLQFPVAWHAIFAARCEARGIGYACTAYLPQDVATLAPFVDYHKVSSFEAMDPEMRQAHRTTPRSELIVSFGLGADPCSWPFGIYRLHCVSAYPAPISTLNLALLTRGGIRPAQFEGLSDHSRHLLAGALAVACGALVVETHFRLDDCDPENPDYPVAFTPAEFAQYIRNIRDAELMLGSGEKRVQACEAPMLRYKVQA